MSFYLHTEYCPTLSPQPLDPERPLTLLGSCFTDSVGSRMRRCRWKAVSNPCGVLYNPLSIAGAVEAAVEGGDVDKTVMQSGPLWVSWLMDSHAAAYSRQGCVAAVRERLDTLRGSLASSQALVVTFGTAWVYELASQPGYVVANCHKQPQVMFVRRRLGVDEIVERWVSLHSLLQRHFPGLRLIFTVSPVRHLKDGFEGNARSKAVLLLACEELCRRIEGAEYFPAYEILNDDLRSYRFYASDMVHPSETAVDYVWQKFQDRYLTPASQAVLAEGQAVTAALAHRPIVDDGSPQARAAIEAMQERARGRASRFAAAHPGMD